MRMVLISDTHCQLDKIEIPDGDILIHSGDITYRGDIKETSQELFELSKYRAKFKHIILVEGNHDWLGQRQSLIMAQLCEDNGITLLRDSGIAIEGLNFWGSPWQPEFCNWAWNLPRGEALVEKWSQIPDNTNILVTHCPPMGILDNVRRFNGQVCEYEIEHVGCVGLYNRIQQLKQLKLHVFGHIHSGYGKLKVGDLTHVNASICTESYKPSNLPMTIEL